MRNSSSAVWGSALVAAGVLAVVFFGGGDDALLPASTPPEATSTPLAAPPESDPSTAIAEQAPTPLAPAMTEKEPSTLNPKFAPEGGFLITTDYPFLPPELEVIGTRFPDELKLFLESTPEQRFERVPMLHTSAMVILLCAEGPGPLPEGHPDERSLGGNHLAEMGMEAFYSNTRTFQYFKSRFPEVSEYYALAEAYHHPEDRSAPRPNPVLPKELEQLILDRAEQAMSYLDQREGY